jgi:Sec-independent protein translocase protein TatA
MASVGLTELIIIGVIGLLVLAVPAALVFFLVVRKKG